MPNGKLTINVLISMCLKPRNLVGLPHKSQLSQADFASAGEVDFRATF